MGVWVTVGSGLGATGGREMVVAAAMAMVGGGSSNTMLAYGVSGVVNLVL